MTQPNQTPDLPNASLPWWHIAMGVSGWILYLFVTHVATLVLAIILSLLAVPRLIRGPWEKADARAQQELKRPVRPSHRAAKRMVEHETLRMEFHDHPARLTLWVLITLVVSILMGLFVFKVEWVVDDHHINWYVGGIIWAAWMTVLTIKMIIWRNDILCLTDKRIFVVRGVLKVRHEFMPLDKLANAKVIIPWHSTILSALRIIGTQYGTLVVDGAGEEDELRNIHFMPYAVQMVAYLGTGGKEQ